MPGIDRSQVLGLFFEEASELLQELSDGLLGLEEAGGGEELVRGLFRVAHTLKGSAAMMELTELSRIAHHMEDLLGWIADGTIDLDAEVVTALLAGVDEIQTCLEPDGDAAGCLQRYETHLEGLRENIHKRGDRSGVATTTPSSSPSQPETSSPKSDKRAGRKVATEKLQTIRVDTGKLNGLINGVGELIISKNILQEGMRTLELVQHEFEQLSFLFGNEAVRLERDLSQLIAQQSSSSQEDFPLFQVGRRIKEEILPMRGELERLNSEFATALASFGQQASSLTNHTLGLKNLVTQVRMVPVTTVFERVPRIVRDAASAEGKKVRLVREGEQTEIDRGVAEKVVDPLLHIIRNAVSHGIEDPESREKRGKEATGVVRLSARTECGRVVIEVSDDGGGMDIDRIREKALASGMVTQGEATGFSDHQWLQMIFRPSFSTAEEVTAISGRGVGMDVVKTAIEGLKGHVEVRSEKGKGSTITLSLPSSLDIARAMRIRAGGQEFVFLMDTIDMARGGRGNEVVLTQEGRFLTLDEKMVPLRRLDALLDLPQEWSMGWADRPILVLRVLDRSAAILVDEIIDHEEVFVKPPHPLLGELALYSGATILGDGRVRPILSASHLLELVAGPMGTEVDTVHPLNVLETLGQRLRGETLLVIGCKERLPSGWSESLAASGVGIREVAESEETFATLLEGPKPAAVLCASPMVAAILDAVADVPLCVMGGEGEGEVELPLAVTHWTTTHVDSRSLSECILHLLG